MMYKESFIKFMVECKVLTFGKFTLKSGRIAPYFINTGNYKTGKQLAILGEFYAQCIRQNGISVETLFGPAYKGIPLACATAIALNNNFGIEVSYCFDRKETKDHGEGGLIVGKSLADGEKVVIIEDVITAGTAIRQVIPILKSVADVDVSAMVISVDRMEKGQGEFSAVQEVYNEFGIKVYPIITVDDIIKAIEDGVIEGKEYLQDMVEYRKKYGI